MSSRSAFALVLIAVDDTALAIETSPWLTRLCYPEVISLSVLIAVDIQLYRAGDIQLRQRRFRFAGRG